MAPLLAVERLTVRYGAIVGVLVLPTLFIAIPAAIGAGDGMPRWARTIAGTVVTSSSSTIRGFVRATYARTESFSVRGRSVAD